jgi:ABC 3 transport family
MVHPVKIVVSMKTVGAVLVFAMLVIPASSADQFAHSMRDLITATILFLVAVTLSPKRRSDAGRLLKTAVLLAGILLLLPNLNITADARGAIRPAASLKLLAVHAHRYQNFEQNRISCEIFGEFQNVGTRKIQSFTLEIELLDEQNRSVATEKLVIMPVSISREAPRGVVKAIEPKDYGYFNMDTVNCPTQWLEGKIKYRVKAVDLE